MVDPRFVSLNIPAIEALAMKLQPHHEPAPDSQIPRRIDVLRMHPAERAIRACIQIIEELGASPSLTCSVDCLGIAKGHLSDHIDENQQSVPGFRHCLLICACGRMLKVLSHGLDEDHKCECGIGYRISARNVAPSSQTTEDESIESFVKRYVIRSIESMNPPPSIRDLPMGEAAFPPNMGEAVRAVVEERKRIRDGKSDADEGIEVSETGAVRGKIHHKGRNGFPILFHLMMQNPDALREWAETYGEGAQKYPPGNWRKGFKESVLINHAMDHLLCHVDGDASENHLAHAMWNIGTLIWMRANKPEMLDVTGVKA